MHLVKPALIAARRCDADKRRLSDRFDSATYKVAAHVVERLEALTWACLNRACPLEGRWSLRQNEDVYVFQLYCVQKSCPNHGMLSVRIDAETLATWCASFNVPTSWGVWTAIRGLKPTLVFTMVDLFGKVVAP